MQFVISSDPRFPSLAIRSGSTCCLNSSCRGQTSNDAPAKGAPVDASVLCMTVSVGAFLCVTSMSTTGVSALTQLRVKGMGVGSRMCPGAASTSTNAYRAFPLPSGSPSIRATPLSSVGSSSTVVPLGISTEPLGFRMSSMATTIKRAPSIAFPSSHHGQESSAQRLTIDADPVARSSEMRTTVSGCVSASSAMSNSISSPLIR